MLVWRWSMAGGVAAVAIAASQEAMAQQQLPELVLTAPSPIRRAPTTPPTNAARPPADFATPPLQGTLPIVTDQFATVTVVPREELQRSPGSTLGDVLFSKPGITGSSFAPGAASRPIIRGLDVNRVGIVDNGIGGGGVSDLGEDHFVPVNPLASGQVEVIRGPATLRYGSQSIGGVVTSVDNRVPEVLPCAPLVPAAWGIYKAPPRVAAPRPCASFEARGALTSADKGREGGLLLDAGAGNFAMHADVFGRRTQDYRVPSYPYLTAPDEAELPFATQPGAFNKRQPNSYTRSDEASVGGSFVFENGFSGVAFTQTNNLYGIPGPEGEGTRGRIDARQEKVIGKGEFRSSSGVVDAIRYWWGYTDYKHNEIALFDALDLSSAGIHQTFTNKDLEGRVEVQLAPFNLRFAEITTALGLQAGHQKLTAAGDDPTSPTSGLFDPNKNDRIAGYIFNEFRFSDTTKAQIAGRIERVDIGGSSPSFMPDIFDVAVDPASIGAVTSRDLSFTPKSVSAGLIQILPGNLVASITGQYVERAPKPAELLSRGPHEATATFDIGNPNLQIEKAKSVEVGLRQATGPFRFEATAYYTRFDGFIFRDLTGLMCGETSCGTPGEEELNQAIYRQRDATFRGGEVQFQWDVLPVWAGFVGVEGQYDIVRATFTDGTNVPRITPQRLGGGVYYRDGEWFARVNLLHAFSQNDIAVTGETPTGGYNLLRAEISRTQNFVNHPLGIQKFTVGLVGNNLLNEDIRNHVSFTKDFVLMPGASLRAFASAKF
jgi:iron complex outermembrane recepter protein